MGLHFKKEKYIINQRLNEVTSLDRMNETFDRKMTSLSSDTSTGFLEQDFVLAQSIAAYGDSILYLTINPFFYSSSYVNCSNEDKEIQRMIVSDYKSYYELEDSLDSFSSFWSSISTQRELFPIKGIVSIADTSKDKEEYLWETDNFDELEDVIAQVNNHKFFLIEEFREKIILDLKLRAVESLKKERNKERIMEEVPNKV